MASCLGLYIDVNVIKYAKVSKDHDNLKIESFGIKFYEKLSEAIPQIIEETYSQKTPISVNLSEEMYNYYDMFDRASSNYSIAIFDIDSNVLYIYSLDT